MQPWCSRLVFSRVLIMQWLPLLCTSPCLAHVNLQALKLVWPGRGVGVLVFCGCVHMRKAVSDPLASALNIKLQRRQQAIKHNSSPHQLKLPCETNCSLLLLECGDMSQYAQEQRGACVTGIATLLQLKHGVWGLDVPTARLTPNRNLGGQPG
jgi:hypothetical protein